jgi:hypothetical protein
MLTREKCYHVLSFFYYIFRELHERKVKPLSNRSFSTGGPNELYVSPKHVGSGGRVIREGTKSRAII